MALGSCRFISADSILILMHLTGAPGFRGHVAVEWRLGETRLFVSAPTPRECKPYHTCPSSYTCPASPSKGECRPGSPTLNAPETPFPCRCTRNPNETAASSYFLLCGPCICGYNLERCWLIRFFSSCCGFYDHVVSRHANGDGKTVRALVLSHPYMRAVTAQVPRSLV